MFYDLHITIYLNSLPTAEHASYFDIRHFPCEIAQNLGVSPSEHRVQANAYCHLATFRSVQVRIAYVLLCRSRAAYRQGAHIITLSLLGSRRRVMSLDMLAIRDEFWHA